MEDMTEKEKYIEKSKRALSKHVDVLIDSKKSVALYLIEEIAFVSCILQELRTNILSSNLVEEYKNGENQNGVKQSANLQAYNSTAKTYNTILKQFVELFDKNVQKELSEDDEFAQFVQKTKAIKK